ncbi:dihydroorotase [Alkalibacillus haloalkaliphilus]|uniref:dihydroorotase n=1 Tax=Alkalibacillus haloalkaliphilus TaxID=94136 RepID=UPI0029358BA5|nr:dihydroorotase [Alkalibacillus haloalkaliphilus]MDV2582570.1 dihydroorotase [Alkalibacillus haloalkaliphilus]
MKILIQNIKLQETNTNLLIEDGLIAGIGSVSTDQVDEIIDGKGQSLFPGFVDLHVHFREPGGEAKETIETGSMAAARGGFTTVCAMPNTRPVPDKEENLERINSLIKDNAHVRVLPYASITTRQLGNELVDFETLMNKGAVAFTDDGVGVQTASKMFEAMQQSAKLNQPIVAHCEDNSLIYGGVMHEGIKNKELNLPGIPSVSESIHIARDILLAEATGCHYHVCHVSTKESVRVIRDAKRAGVNVTAEVTPHHLLLSELDISEDDANYKMNPPLRGEADRQALIEGLLDGTIDCIATDHAPHTREEKENGFMQSPFGIVGLETAFPLLYTHFVKNNRFTLDQLIDWLTVKPAQLFDLPYGTLQVGSKADLVLVDLDQEESIDTSSFYSKGTNTPFQDWKVTGIPTLTVVDGKVVWKKEETYV